MPVSTDESTVIIPLEGIDSAHGASLIEKGLTTIKFISDIRVDSNFQRVLFNATNKPIAIQEAIQLIRSMGFGVTARKKNYPLLNMSCTACAGSAQSVLEQQPGVISAAVNYANGEANIEYLSNITDPTSLKTALLNIGYDLMIEEHSAALDELEQLHQQAFQELKKNTLAAMTLSAPIVIIGMFFMEMPYGNYILWLLTTLVLFFFGKQFYINAWKQAKHGNVNMDTLVAMSTGVAYLFSVFNTLSPNYWQAHGLEGHVYYEAAAVVIAFILLGKWLEEKAKGNTASAIKKLIGLQPQTVNVVLSDGTFIEKSIASVQVGNILQVRPGDKIAVDGKLISGNSFVDESMISGEPIPKEKVAGSTVYAGTINQKGSFQFLAEKVGEETLLAHIIKKVKEAQGSRAPIQKTVDKIARIFVPIVLAIAILTFIIWLVFGGENGLSKGLLSFVTVLVIACPCALGLATPTAIMAGIGVGAAHGILIKDAESLEMAVKMNALIMDKTGTITEGKPKVIEACWLNNEPNLKSILASIEKKSEHPLAEAIITHLAPSAIIHEVDFESFAGKGASASVNGDQYLVGNLSLLEDFKIPIDPLLIHQSSLWIQKAYTLVWFADKKEVIALLAINDTIKTTAAKAIEQMHEKGIEVYMLTGDNQAAAKHTAAATGIRYFKGNMLPADKAAFVKQLQQEGKIVGMVGDGINDSSALAQANVSIAMGKGSDIAMEVAKMTLLSSDLTKINQAIEISKFTRRTIRQNLFWAFIYNVISIPIAAGILYPLNGFLLHPMIAGAAMAMSSVSVVSNSLRLKKIRL
jgi:Cu2+-exporting ATPase